ncbi:MAG: O-antigen ligase family protein [Flavobacteriaceae bacterium]|nr:O-antigen ligase family protein [Flavobacteriaceae bacterium]
MVLGLIIFLGLMITRKYPFRFLFWIGVSLVFVRPLILPFVGEINISYVIFTVLVLLNPLILFGKNQLKEWRLWYIVLLFGIMNAVLFGQSKEYFRDRDVFTAAFDWSTKFLIVILISSGITYFVKTEKDLKKLMYLFLMSCAIFSFTATMSYFGFYDGIIIFGNEVKQDVSSANSSNLMIYSKIYGISASNLVFGLCPTAILFLSQTNWRKWQKYIFISLIVFAVMISLKRLALIGLILSLIGYVNIESKRYRMVWLLPIIIMFLLSSTSFFDLFVSRFFDSSYSAKSSFLIKDSETRLARYNLAWESFAKSPLIGQGSGYLTYVHNGFLEMLGNLGIVGLVLFKPLVRPLKNIKTSLHNPWALALIITMLTIISLEAGINRVEIMYFIGLLYGGFLVSKKIRK